MSTHHSDVHAGLQDHSIGELYPWSIACKDGPDGLRCVPFHCLSGAWGPEFPADHDNFSHAHQSAERWVRLYGAAFLERNDSVNTLGYSYRPGKPAVAEKQSVEVVELVRADDLDAIAKPISEVLLQWHLWARADGVFNEYYDDFQGALGQLAKSVGVKLPEFDAEPEEIELEDLIERKDECGCKGSDSLPDIISRLASGDLTPQERAIIIDRLKR